MANIIVYTGDTWTFETTLTDSDGNAITSLTDAWVSLYSDQTTELFTYQLSDAELSLTSNVLTAEIAPATTTALDAGTYYFDVKIKETDGTVSTVIDRQRIRVVDFSPLYDNY